MGECGLRTLVRNCNFPTSIVSQEAVCCCRFYSKCARFKGDRIKVRGEEVRIYIIVVIVVDSETFGDLTGFLLLSLGGQVYICKFVSFHKSQCTKTEQNFDHT